MKHRLKLQEKLESIIGNKNVYFQPPENLKLSYPCIVYSLSLYQNIHANDNVYLQNDNYSVTVIDKDPESKIVDKISLLPMTSFDRHYVSDNLYHSVFTIYY